jgi:hypothetical protein
MKLKASYATEEEIPEGYAALYTERNGQFELTGIDGVKTQADIDRVSNALRKEREDHKKSRESLQAFGDLNPEEVHTKLETFDSLNEQLEALKANGGNPNNEQVESLVAARVKAALGPVERQRDQIQRRLEDTTKQVSERENVIGELRTGMTQERIERAVRDAAVGAKVIAPAINDAVLHSRGLFEVEEGTNKIITKDVAGVTPGLSPTEWLNDMKEKAPHWWPTSLGGGAGGGGPNGGNLANSQNPWSPEGWNVTKQGAYVRQFGLEKAVAMAERVGSKVGATKPTKAA